MAVSRWDGRLRRSRADSPGACRDFAAHYSLSLQHTAYAMGKQRCSCADVTEVTLTASNRHHIWSITPFGLDNPNDVFVATDEPYGLIRSDRSPQITRSCVVSALAGPSAQPDFRLARIVTNERLEARRW